MAANVKSVSSEIQILRPGGITEEMLREALSKWSKPVAVTRAASEASPGHLKHHYMPAVPLVIVEGSRGLPLSPSEAQTIRGQLKLESLGQVRELDLSDDPALAARELYGKMRDLAESGAQLIFVRHSNEMRAGLWQAIWDRLTRAATLSLLPG
jgi:L-threonylcarbamoyladenylate synthase